MLPPVCPAFECLIIAKIVLRYWTDFNANSGTVIVIDCTPQVGKFWGNLTLLRLWIFIRYRYYIQAQYITWSLHCQQVNIYSIQVRYAVQLFKGLITGFGKIANFFRRNINKYFLGPISLVSNFLKDECRRGPVPTWCGRTSRISGSKLSQIPTALAVSSPFPGMDIPLPQNDLWLLFNQLMSDLSLGQHRQKQQSPGSTAIMEQMLWNTIDPEIQTVILAKNLSLKVYQKHRREWAVALSHRTFHTLHG